MQAINDLVATHSTLDATAHAHKSGRVYIVEPAIAVPLESTNKTEKTQNVNIQALSASAVSLDPGLC